MKLVLALVVSLSTVSAFAITKVKEEVPLKMKLKETRLPASTESTSRVQHYTGPNGYTGGHNCYRTGGQRAPCNVCGLSVSGDGSNWYNCK